ncbi:hypothetical protein PPTG_23678 [Phytophthora nicotianae INRA-310]|uniref:RxLR effector protein n=1 Tax=Phytophthora nicotianae (strain INRA-310) TaxID=761204 RepID=W2PTM7_PHYN3|nr:hypothetical protein PPTG_23678 [Phytophthora nicotianae INRA-310]ETN03996.1 hypothetical protein PPTG_23678 [Phytophthora nicotianae INRA-310]
MFKLENGMETALASPNLKKLEEYVSELNVKSGNNKASVIEIFIKHYGDDKVAKALVTAQRKADMVDGENMISQLRDAQLSSWRESEKSVDDVFTLLKLREDGYRAFGSPKMQALEDYTKRAPLTNPVQKNLLQTLTTGFGGERKLARLLVVAKRDSNSKDLATAMQKALLKKWMQVDKMNPEDVLKKLRLEDDAMEKILTDKNRYTLVEFISMYNAKNPDTTTSLIRVLSAHYGVDGVAKRLVTGSTGTNTKVVAKKLRAEQLNEWLISGKSVNHVFKMLKLRDDGYLALTSRKLEVLEDYIAASNSKKGGDETLLKALTTGFGGETEMKQILAMGKLNPYTIKRAMSLQLEQWLVDNLKPEDVLQKLGLGRGLEDAIPNKNLQYLDSFISMYKAAYPNTKISLTGTLSAHYGDDVLAKVLAAALNKDALLDQNRYTLTAYISLFNEKNPASKKSLLETLLGHYGDVAVAEALTIAESKRATKNLATQMQIQQFQQWQKSGKSAGAIFKQLDIDVDEFLLVMSSKLEALEDYNTTLKVGNLRYKQDTFTVVRKGFGDDVELALVVVRALKTLELENANIPVSTATVKLFGDGENIASSLEKAVVQRYTQYYRNKMAPPPVNAVIDPRRS